VKLTVKQLLPHKLRTTKTGNFATMK